MGLSGFKGKVFLLNNACPLVSCSQYGRPSTGLVECMTDEVTRFSVVDSVQLREYGHDKSQGWQDTVSGIRRLEVTIDAIVHRDNTGGLGGTGLIYAGKTLYLELFPIGTAVVGGCDTSAAEGYATVRQVSYQYDQETGQPISYTATLASKGPWIGVGGDDAQWGGFECGCATA